MVEIATVVRIGNLNHRQVEPAQSQKRVFTRFDVPCQ